MERKKIIYKILVGLLVVLFGFGGISNLLLLPDMVASLNTLGYPEYFGRILGLAQVLGIMVLVAPVSSRLKEWAFAGFYINLISAIASHLIVEGLVPAVGIILVALVILTTAFVNFMQLKTTPNQ
ncbi:DoxX family protein [Tunicatimonas pelagia]|uniref:DoxX family protein n=1 Tax=Tunicatimonas pelagia TaxID=931531 RepID=UPI0026668133|nr:DoxX family protein [Tunicatimonas pelagia]WKN43191.1 DoxX family protein [Tunicatimonas pelagia]